MRNALIAKYNKCAGICLGDTVTQWLLHIPSSFLSLTFPAVSQAGWRTLCFWSSNVFSPSGLDFPLSAFIWLCLREILFFGPVWLPACLPLFYSYTIGSDWRLSVNIRVRVKSQRFTLGQSDQWHLSAKTMFSKQRAWISCCCMIILCPFFLPNCHLSSFYPSIIIIITFFSFYLFYLFLIL